MYDGTGFGREFFERLEAVDGQIAASVAAAGCAACGGRLHRSDYLRKPRGGLFGAAAETFAVRFSFCCAREGCRQRATPPSVRFLGRRVYVGAVVIVASVLAMARRRASERKTTTGVPSRTLDRWLAWWQGSFPRTAVFVQIAARLVTVATSELPRVVLDRLDGDERVRVARLLLLLAPLTTVSVADGSRFSRGLRWTG